MRMAYVCADRGVPVFGKKGAAYHVQEVVRAACELGHQVELFALRVGGRPPIDLADIPAHKIPFESCGDGAVDECELLRANVRVNQLLQARGPFDVIYERHALWSYAAMEFAQETGASGILEVNAPLITEQRAFRHLHNERSVAWAAKRAFDAAEYVAVVSADIVEYAYAHGARQGCVRVVPNGVRAERFVNHPRHTRPTTRPFTIGFVGSLRPWHAVNELVKAFVNLSRNDHKAHFALRIIGDGPQRESLNEQVARLPTEIQESIHFAGAVDYEAIPSELAGIDVAVVPYSCEHGGYCSPLKLFEYLAAGLPVVAAGTAPVRQIIGNGANGMLYSPGDVGQLTVALHRLYADAELRGRLGQNARHDVEQHHTWRQRVSQILDCVGAPTAAGRTTPHFQMSNG